MFSILQLIPISFFSYTTIILYNHIFILKIFKNTLVITCSNIICFSLLLRNLINSLASLKSTIAEKIIFYINLDNLL